MTLVDSAPGASPSVGALPGRLVVRNRAIERLAAHAIGAVAREWHAEPDVSVLSSDDEHVELSAVLVLDYPTEAISAILQRVRSALAAEIDRQLGRRLGHLDLTVRGFNRPLQARPRRVRVR